MKEAHELAANRSRLSGMKGKNYEDKDHSPVLGTGDRVSKKRTWKRKSWKIVILLGRGNLSNNQPEMAKRAHLRSWTCIRRRTTSCDTQQSDTSMQWLNLWKKDRGSSQETEAQKEDYQTSCFVHPQPSLRNQFRWRGLGYADLNGSGKRDCPTSETCGRGSSDKWWIFPAVSWARNYQHPQSQKMNASKQKDFVILSLSMCTVLNQ